MKDFDFIKKLSSWLAPYEYNSSLDARVILHTLMVVYGLKFKYIYCILDLCEHFLSENCFLFINFLGILLPIYLLTLVLKNMNVNNIILGDCVVVLFIKST